MDIGIIGTGRVGENLGTGLLRAGHEIRWGSRQPESARARAVVDRAGGGEMATVPDALAAAVILLAVTGDQTLDVASRLDDWTDKVVIDATNVLGPNAPSPLGLSPTEQFATAAAGSQVARAFNTIGAEHYLDPIFAGRPATMFLCGSTVPARSVAATLAADLGFDPVDIGDLSESATLDHLARLWVGLVMGGQRNRDFAITIVER